MRRQAEGSELISRVDGRALEETVDQLLFGVRHSVELAVMSGGVFADRVTKVLAERASLAPRLVVRGLWSAEAVPDLLDLGERLRHLRMEIRVAEGELRELLVVDGEVALVRADSPELPLGYAVTVRDPAAVRVLELLFAGAWSGARRLSAHLGMGERLRTDQSRAILAKLCAGYTDEEAAGEMGVSLRTYRRRVAEIMGELGATSRFQAGLRAGELGLLRDKAV
ncbi:helix-turn-helix transcriptional regulator [Streptomyces coffeae]|uniref:DNA-binding response regulator n=1 Tax=Streptomyces coffeae TaxID=621382 RepID=A0ABS1NK34_9ACTN|nr:DNA-binding response regulator [Streptomyces coffeae]MBL1100443.1 DNA-binding response regulator [Streptomyces coffeae]